MKRFCPVCETVSKAFNPFGFIPREDAMCPVCGALERHRLVWIYLRRELDFLSSTPQSFLHVAPERVFNDKFETCFQDAYVTADISGSNVKVKMDIMDIQYPESSFDCILCSHVLEHVLDDRIAMREFYRVLRSGGWAILLVPIVKQGPTFEDNNIIDPQERMRVFGHPEHVRNYGEDYPERLRESGFEVTTIVPSDFLSQEEIERMGLTKASGKLFFCTK